MNSRFLSPFYIIPLMFSEWINLPNLSHVVKSQICHSGTEFTDSSDNNSTLSILPDEVLFIILTNLNQQDVVNFMLVNKRFYNVGNQKLYRSIYLGSGLVVSRKIYTPFYLKYTIVQDFASFRINVIGNVTRRRLIKSVVIDRYRDLEYSVLTTELPWAETTIEVCSDDLPLSGHVPILDLLLFAGDSQFAQSRIENSNYSIKKLTIDCYESNHEVLEIIPQLKSLSSLRLIQAQPDIFRQLEDLKITNLKLEELYFSLTTYGFTDDRENHLSRLGDIFSLAAISTLGLHVAYYNRPLYPDMKWLLERLPQLRNLYLDCHQLDYREVSGLLRPNSLSTLHFRQLKDNIFLLNYCSRLITKLIESQQQSLIGFSLSDHTMSSWVVGSRNFERVMNLKHVFCNVGDKQGKRIIKRVLGNGKKFPKLNTIVLNEVYHVIDRIQDNIRIIRIN